MKQIYFNQNNIPNLFSRRLLKYQIQLTTHWRQIYTQTFPDEPELIMDKLNEINLIMLTDYLEGKTINCCDKYIGSDNTDLINMGISQMKVVASFRIYLKAARIVLRNQVTQPGSANEILTVFEQLQSIEQIIMFKSFAYTETEEFEKLITVFDKGLTSAQLEKFFHQLLSDAIKVTHANGGKVLLVDQHQPGIMQIVACTDQKNLKVADEIQAVLINGQPIFLFPPKDEQSEKNITNGHTIPSIWLFPIKIKNQSMGLILLYFNKFYKCHIKEREIIEILLERAAITVSRVLLIDSIRSDEQRIRKLTERIIIVQNEESRRISHELYNETSDSLLVINLYLEMIYKDLPHTLLPTRKKIQEAILLVNKIVQDVRHITADLSPALLDQYGLIDSLRLQTKTVKEIFKLSVVLKISNQFPKLPRAIEVAIYHVIQEALNNAAHHAHATKVTVNVKYQKELVMINIQDDGIGFDIEQFTNMKQQPFLGLIGMQERVFLHGGEFAIESQPDKGTKISISLPTVTR